MFAIPAAVTAIATTAAASVAAVAVTFALNTAPPVINDGGIVMPGASQSNTCTASSLIAENFGSVLLIDVQSGETVAEPAAGVDIVAPATEATVGDSLTLECDNFGMTLVVAEADATRTVLYIDSLYDDNAPVAAPEPEPVEPEPTVPPAPVEPEPVPVAQRPTNGLGSSVWDDLGGSVAFMSASGEATTEPTYGSRAVVVFDASATVGATRSVPLTVAGVSTGSIQLRVIESDAAKGFTVYEIL